MWWYVRVAIVGAAVLGGLFGQGRDLQTGYTLLQLATATFAFGVVAMLFIIGLQAFNPRSAAEWAFPSWSASPFTMKQPLQLFHLAGYFFLGSGLGGMLHVAFDRTLSVVEPTVFASTGAGVLFGVWLCCRAFHRKMART